MADTPRENLPAEFASVVEAINCPVEIQRELADRNAELPETRKMQFRIGAYLWDVLEEEGLIYGYCVNIAVRVESLAEGGGICICGSTYDYVKNKLGLEHESPNELWS